MKPYETAKLLKIYLKENNKTEIKFFFETPFDTMKHQENLKYLVSIKVLSTDSKFSYFKPTNYYKFYLIFHISPYQIFNFYKFIKDLI